MTYRAENRILTDKQSRQKIHRIACQIYEDNFDAGELILAGIRGKGLQFAELLAGILREISQVPVRVIWLDLDKFLPTQSEIRLGCESAELENKSVIVVDDVLNTGRTLAYSLQPFLEIRIQKLQIAVLVDREHRLFPVSADYVGYSLSTTIKEHVDVNLEDGSDFGVYLN